MEAVMGVIEFVVLGLIVACIVKPGLIIPVLLGAVLIVPAFVGLWFFWETWNPLWLLLVVTLVPLQEGWIE
jgi:hypothetical protein